MDNYVQQVVVSLKVPKRSLIPPFIFKYIKNRGGVCFCIYRRPGWVRLHWVTAGSPAGLGHRMRRPHRVSFLPQGLGMGKNITPSSLFSFICLAKKPIWFSSSVKAQNRSRDAIYKYLKPSHWKSPRP